MSCMLALALFATLANGQKPFQEASAKDQSSPVETEGPTPNLRSEASEMFQAKLFDRKAMRFDIEPTIKIEDGTREAAVNKDSRAIARQNNWYVRPDGKTRAKRYVNSIVGPIALARYTAVAGVLTARNAPKEWGGQWEGFGRRFASNFGKSAINNSVKYGLDEVLKVDSRFYLSQDRSVSARLRNAVFSTVTARNSKGKRVFGIPKIAGQLAGNVISATTWYPERYGVSHGLKGAAIGLAVDAGVNLFREFILKK